MAVLSNLSVDQGADYSAEVVVEDAQGNIANLANFTVAGQIRKSYASSTATNFTATITNAGNGLITLKLSNTTTNGMKAGRYIYDVEVTDSAGAKTRVVEGQITINPGVTKI